MANKVTLLLVQAVTITWSTRLRCQAIKLDKKLTKQQYKCSISASNNDHMANKVTLSSDKV